MSDDTQKEDETGEAASQGSPLELIADQAALSDRTLALIVKRVPAQKVALRIEQMVDAQTPQGNPDWRARENGVKLWLSYIVGEPIQRQQIVRVNKRAASLAELLTTPAGLEAFMRAVENAPAEVQEALRKRLAA